MWPLAADGRCGRRDAPRLALLCRGPPLPQPPPNGFRREERTWKRYRHASSAPVVPEMPASPRPPAPLRRRASPREIKSHITERQESRNPEIPTMPSSAEPRPSPLPPAKPGLQPQDRVYLWLTAILAGIGIVALIAIVVFVRSVFRTSPTNRIPRLVAEINERFMDSTRASIKESSGEMGMYKHLTASFGYRGGALLYEGDLDVILKAKAYSETCIKNHWVATHGEGEGKYVDLQMMLSEPSKAYDYFRSTFSEKEICLLEYELQSTKTEDDHDPEREQLLKEAGYSLGDKLRVARTRLSGWGSLSGWARDALAGGAVGILAMAAIGLWLRRKSG
jgi:hypothetical protein